MAEYQNIRTGRHGAFVLHAHLVFVTKYRHKVFNDQHLTRLDEITRSVCQDFEVEMVEFNGENNHVHLLGNFPPKAALSKLVNSGRSGCGPARTSSVPSAGRRCRSASTSSTRNVRCDLRVTAVLRVASPPP
ncbi:transposase IS200 family protein [Streptomyces sp. SLBN-118]|nr:transposase IS200 family protein [Streptomyces sp. SLBN-118]